MSLISSPDLGASSSKGRSPALIGNRDLDDPGEKKGWKLTAVVTAAIIIVALGLGLGLGLGYGLKKDVKSTRDQNTLEGKIEQDPGLDTLGQILSETTNVQDTLSNASQKLTLFAPTNDAFDAFFTASGITAAQALKLPTLSNILLGHTLGSVESGAALTRSAVSVYNTLGQNIVVVKYNSGTGMITITPAIGGSAAVSKADVNASNGVFHKITAVVDINANLAVIAGDNGLATLVAAASQTQCAAVLTALTAPASRLTVFAPTDAAFTAFFAAQGITATQALALPTLPTILLGHTVQGVYTSADLMAAPSTTLTTLAGTSITIQYDSSSGTITVTPAVGGSATVAIADVGASNGIAHAITAVLDVKASLVVYAGDYPDLSTLVATVEQPQSSAVLAALSSASSTLTLFGPTDDAFTAFFAAQGITATEALALPSLPTILLGHTLGSVKNKATLMSSAVSVFKTLGQNIVVVKYDSGSKTVTVAPAVGGSATVSMADVDAGNGVLNTITAVIDINANLAVIAGDNGLATLVTAASQSQCADVLTALTTPASRLTVFGPTDDAFTAFFAAQGITATDALALASLPTILLGHTLGSVQTSVDLTALAVTAVDTLGPNMVLAKYDSATGAHLLP